MSDKTTIEWTEATWNPIRARRKDGQPNKGGGGWACQRVSAGCQNCYAATINKRLGTGFDYDAKGIAASDIYLDEKTLLQPLHWRRPRKVFVCSMTDLFGEWVPDEMIDRVFAVMALSPQHTFQVLTKRPERMREYLTERHTLYEVDSVSMEMLAARTGQSTVELPRTDWPLPNVWLGVSVEDQERADQRIPELLATPAAVRFLSCEPLLGRLLLDNGDSSWLTCNGQEHPDEYCLTKQNGWPYGHFRGIDWVIVGGESGTARPCDVEWIRGIVRQCQAADVAVFVKQLGARPVTLNFTADGNTPGAFPVRDRKGGAMDEWPQDLRVREFPR